MVTRPVYQAAFTAWHSKPSMIRHNLCEVKHSLGSTSKIKDKKLFGSFSQVSDPPPPPPPYLGGFRPKNFLRVYFAF